MRILTITFLFSALFMASGAGCSGKPKEEPPPPPPVVGEKDKAQVPATKGIKFQ